MKTLIAPHYRILFTCLFSLHPWMNWLWVLGGVIIVVGIPIYLIWGSPLGFAFGGIILVAVGFMNLVGVPYQLLSINSSKQIGLLPGIREMSLYIFGFIGLCTSIILTVMLYVIEPRAILDTFCVVLVLVSVVLLAAVVIGQKYAGAQGMIFVCFWMLGPLYRLLVNVHWALLFVFCMSLWLAFSKHWLKWRPLKFQPNIFGMSHDQLLAFNKQRSAQFTKIVRWQDNFLRNSAETLVGSLLLGRADGIRSKWVSAVSIFLMLSLIAAAFIVLSSVEKFKSYYEVGGQINICIFYICAAYGLSLWLFRNLMKPWMYFDGGRENYFQFVEKIFFGNLLAVALPVLLIHIVANYLILDWQMYVELIWLMAAFAFVVIAITFYATLYIYHKTKGNLNWSMWVNNILLLVAAVPLVASNLLWVDHKSQVITFAVYFILGSVLAIIIFRRWVKQKWIFVDLVKVRS